MKAAVPVLPSLKVMAGSTIEIRPLLWDDLVLGRKVIRLVKDDPVVFLQREARFREHRLPVRRGDLVHGMPRPDLAAPVISQGDAGGEARFKGPPASGKSNENSQHIHKNCVGWTTGAHPIYGA